MERYVGPYRILRLIDQGGQGGVYLGYDERLQRQVAIKIYVLPGQRAGRRRLLREARLVAGMDSPKVVAVHDVIQSSGYLAMVMEYVPGCSLGDLLAARRPSLPAVLTVGIDIAGALAVAMRNRVVHGDVKPANVLIGEKGRARLTDFGISRRLETGAGYYPVAGSAEAMSPEQCAGEPVDGRSDLFALGLLLYRMLWGGHPFYRDGTLDPGLLLRCDPPLPETGADGAVEVPAAVRDAVARLLARDPAARPRHTRGIRQLLRGALRELPVATHNSLLREARPLFRPELPQDAPLPVPRELGSGGRSRLPPRGGPGTRSLHWLRSLGLPGRAAVAAGGALALALPVAFALRDGVSVVRFEEPTVVHASAGSPPSFVSVNWLLAQMRTAVREELGPLEVVGSVGAAPPRMRYSAAGAVDLRPAAQQTFSIGVRCAGELCLVAAGRSAAGTAVSARDVLFADAPARDWEEAVRRTAAELFR